MERQTGIHQKLLALRTSLLMPERRSHSPSNQVICLNKVRCELESLIADVACEERQLDRQNEKLRAAEFKADEAWLRLNELMEAVPSPWVSTDFDGIIKKANESAADFLNVKGQLLHCSAILRFMNDANVRIAREHLRQISETGKAIRWETSLTPCSEPEVSVSILLAASGDGEGEAAVHWFIRDACELERARERIEHLEAEALQRDAQNSEIVRQERAARTAMERSLAVVGHELRGHLSPLLGVVECLRRTPNLPEEVVLDIAVIHDNVQLQARLISDLYDYARTSQGKFELKFEPTDLIGVLQRVQASGLRNISNEKHLVIQQDFPEERHLVNADPARLFQAFSNLVRNAIQYTPEGGQISLRCRWQAGKALVDISDSGKGISQVSLQHVFEAFHQAECHGNSGLGLGLTITKAIIDEHGGTITVASEGAGQGATFHIELPYSIP